MSRLPEIKPEHMVTYKQCQDLIDKAATVISACIGSVLLFFYAHGLLKVVGYWS